MKFHIFITIVYFFGVNKWKFLFILYFKTQDCENKLLLHCRDAFIVNVLFMTIVVNLY